MNPTKLFISHSLRDKPIADALIGLLTRAGISESNILCSSTPGTHIPTGAPLYKELRNTLISGNAYAIFLLSDNFYSSVVCLNEMGAVWVENIPYQFIVLPGFSFDRIQGVIKDSEIVGISLSPVDSMTKERFTDFRETLQNLFGIEISPSIWERARDSFLDLVQRYTEDNLHFSIDMTRVEGLCIGETRHDGCCIKRNESSSNKSTVYIDFSKTATSLCSTVFYLEDTDWQALFRSNRQLCFNIFSDSKDIRADVELLVNGRNVIFPIFVSDDTQNYRIPLTQFSMSQMDWKSVKQIKFLFRKERIKHPIKVVIENVRLE